MKIVVIGGTGLIGSKIVQNLKARGHHAVAASPSSGVNTVTGAGLDDVLQGADVVVDVANSPSFEDAAAMTFFDTGGRNLLAAEARAGVKHHVALSVVGTDRLLASGYFRAKMAQEKLIQASPIPYSIVRATQFFEFIGAVADSSVVDGMIRVPTALMQPIVSHDVAAVMSEVALSAPTNRIDEIAGPTPYRIDEIVRQYLAEQSDSRQVITDDSALYFGLALEKRSLMPGPHARLTAMRFTDWLRQLVRHPSAVAGG